MLNNISFCLKTALANHVQPRLPLYKQVGPAGRPGQAADGEIESDTSPVHGKV